MNQPISEDEVIVEKRGGLGVITLNRPQALNAITLEMIRQISSVLKNWERDKTVKAVFFAGAGERAFSAGGDLKAFHRAGMDFRRGQVASKVPAVFFAEEYSLNRQIFHYPKPAIAFMNGITMGGGFGVAGNCKYHIATDKTVFAMPETGIGFFPDVGSVYHLLRCPKNIGRYLALTGIFIKGWDVIHAGIADCFIRAEKQYPLMGALERSALTPEVIESILGAHAERGPPETEFSKIIEKIDSVFRIPNAHALFAVLEKDDSAWAKETLEILRRRSPTSVLVAAAHLVKSEGRSFDEVIRTDFTLAQRFVERMDLYEGIRAALIDRDAAPKWEPASYSDITEDAVEGYFAPTGWELDDIQIFAA